MFLHSIIYKQFFQVLLQFLRTYFNFCFTLPFRIVCVSEFGQGKKEENIDSDGTRKNKLVLMLCRYKHEKVYDCDYVLCKMYLTLILMARNLWFTPDASNEFSIQHMFP